VKKFVEKARIVTPTKFPRQIPSLVWITKAFNLEYSSNNGRSTYIIYIANS